MERLDKILARRGVGSRAMANRLCRRGKVMVGQKVIRQASTRVDPEATIWVDGQALLPLPRLVCYHKPFGVHSTMSDPQGRPSLAEALPEYLLEQLHPVGRLDAETTGLLLFSHEGTLTQRLLHPKHGVEREYVALVEHEVASPEDLRQTLAAGVETAEGVFPAHLKEVQGARLTLVVTEGKHRMVRRILANAGFPVVELQRVRYGPFELGELEPGQWREAQEEELLKL